MGAKVPGHGDHTADRHEGNSATIHGTGNEYGSPTVPFRVDVTVGHPDTFKIAWPGYAAGGSVTGDIVIVTTCGLDVMWSRRP